MHDKREKIEGGLCGMIRDGHSADHDPQIADIEMNLANVPCQVGYGGQHGGQVFQSLDFPKWNGVE